MSESVLDASALLAYLKDEPGAEVVEERLLTGAAISTVNWSEVLAKMAERGERAERELRRLMEEWGVAQLLEIVPFSREDAERAASLRAATRSLGLSLGDRACLAFAWRLDRPALTADRSWLDLSLPFEVVAIR